MGFGSFFGAIGLATIKAEIRAAGRRLAIASITGVLLITAICFAVAAFAVWLAHEIGTVAALLAIAGAFLILALIIQGVARLASAPPRRRPAYPSAVPPPAAPPPQPPPPPAGSPVAGNAVPLGSELGVVATVALAGFLLARQMLRR